MDDLLGSCSNQNLSETGLIFSTLFTAIITATCNLTKQNEWPQDYGPKLFTESKIFDYIVVGAGAAGATIAGRLGENPNHNVLVLEAGEDPPLYSTIPGMQTILKFKKTKYDWEYYAERSAEHSLAVNNGIVYLPRGKVIGGCSSINEMVYIRGNRKDFDSWEADGNTGWGYDSVLKYFKKTENLQIKKLLESDKGKYHGTTGEIKISERVGDAKLGDFINSAFKELGYKFNEDINAETNTGVNKVQGNIDNGVRSSPATAFLKDRKRNLFIVKNALVSKIIIDKLKKKATGVEYINDKGKTIIVNVTKEVIISGGAINSPQLLMLSGVGPAKHLQELQIPVVADLPVGLNFQDHLLIPYFINLKNDISEYLQIDYTDSLYNYLISREGPLTQPIKSDYLVFINTSNATYTYPNIQILNFYYSKNDPAIRKILESAGYSEELIKSVEKINKKSNLLMMNTFLLNPKSTGEVKLRNTNPQVKPKIDLKYLQEKEDVDVLLQSAHFVQKFLSTSTIKKMGAEIIQPMLKTCDDFEFISNEYWICYFRNIGRTGHHFAGSVKMGPVGDKTSVVSPGLKVHGIKGLRVADASIMPNIVSANTYAAAVMIGEKAADMIKRDSN